MEMKYYNSSNNFRAPIPREPKPYRPPEPVKEVVIPQAPEPQEEISVSDVPKAEDIIAEKNKKTEFSQDDLLLLGLIFLLLLNSCDDYLLLLILGYLFISGRKGL